MLRFIDGEGNECEQLRTVMSWGESLILPNVPDTDAPDMWKLEKNEKLGDAITLKGGDILTLKKGESWNLFLEKGILNFYMPKKCTVSLYNNSGTSVFSNGILQVYETKNVILPDMPSSKYINYGWTDTKGSSAVKYELNSEFTVTGDTDFYIVRRTALQVNFKTNTGASNSKFTRLNQKVGKGLTVTMPQVPVKTGYQSLGWSKNKKASKADYKAGQNVTVSKTLTLYAVYKKLPYTVTFNNNNGTSTSKIYTSLTMYASKNQKVTLPDVPKVKGYTNLGWTTEKGETEPEYSAGDTVKITKATRFYAVRRKSNYYTVSYYLGNGSTNAAKIHYAMPLRHMVGDAFSYMKEYDEIAAVNKKNGDFHSADEFLSGFKKTDRLHPVISLCVYYGESEWDGPFSLKDMLEIPEKIESLVSDYRMNLVQVRSSGELCFSDPDVNMVFDVSRLIYV